MVESTVRERLNYTLTFVDESHTHTHTYRYQLDSEGRITKITCGYFEESE